MDREAQMPIFDRFVRGGGLSAELNAQNFHFKFKSERFQEEARLDNDSPGVYFPTVTRGPV